MGFVVWGKMGRFVKNQVNKLMATKNKIKSILLNVILPLFLGGAIYLFLRSESLIMFDWIKFLGLKDGLDVLRENIISIKFLLPDWVLFSLPDALWVYSFTSVLIIIWNSDINVLIFLLSFPLIAGPGVEFLQFLNLFEGTFDFSDLLLTLLAFLISLKFNLKINQYENQVC